MTRPLNRLASIAAAMAGAAAFTFAAPVVAPAALGVVSTAKAQQPAQFEQILAAYGTFQAHARYGQVWIPSRDTVPEGWHPYPPCNWVHHKELGWYFNDTTEWGKIVHHYGRWAHDKALGWVWVKGEEFSPAWVVWRTSDKWVGWAPMPPDMDVKEISATEFNSDKHWIFVDAKKFASTCNDGSTIVSAPPALYPTILTQTTVVTQIRFVRGIVVFVLPPPLIINIVDIDINVGIFPPWNPCFFGAWFWNWNWMVNNIIVVVNNPPPNCPQPIQKQLQPLPIISTPPPGPGPGPGFTPPPRRPDQRTELPPRLDPPRVIDPQRPPLVQVPPRLIDPPRQVRPIDPQIIRPDRQVRPIDPQVIKPDRQVRPNEPQIGKPDRRVRPIDLDIVRPIKPIGPRIVDVPPRQVKPTPQVQQPQLVRKPDLARQVPKVTHAPQTQQGKTPIIR